MPDLRLPSRPLRDRAAALGLGLAAVVLVAASVAVAAEPVRDLPPGDPDRRAILDVLRPALELEMRGPVEFRVSFARTLRGWGLVRVTPQRPGGAAIEMRETVFADAPFMDGLTTDALFQRRAGRWYLITHVVGPTDAASSDWMFGDVPRRLFIPTDTEETEP